MEVVGTVDGEDEAHGAKARVTEAFRYPPLPGTRMPW